MGGSTQRESAIEPAVASNLRTVAIPETGWWLLTIKFVPATVRYLRVEREGKRPLIIPFNSGAPVMAFGTYESLGTPTAVYLAAAGTVSKTGTVLNMGISIWLERGDRFLFVSSTGATVATDSLAYSMINTKFLPVLSFYNDNTAIPA